MDCQHCCRAHTAKPGRSEAEATRRLYNRGIWFLALCTPFCALICAVFAIGLDQHPPAGKLIFGLSTTAFAAGLAGIILGLTSKKSAIAEAAAKDQRRIARTGGL